MRLLRLVTVTPSVMLVMAAAFGGAAARSNAVAATSTAQRAGMPMHQGMMDFRGMMGRGMMLQATATVERLPNGARLTLKPADASELGALRMHVDHMVDMMAGASGQQ